MPYTLNGVGTWYWGKRNVYREAATCPDCGAFGEKTSYDTTLYFVVAFVPLIPLGHKRIFRECPKCRRHRVMSLKEWEALKKKDVAALTEKIKATPGDETLQQQLLLTLINHQDVEGTKKVLHRLLDSPVHTVGLWNAIAAAHEFCADLPSARHALEEARQLVDTPESREALARILLKQIDPDAAIPCVEHLLTTPNPQKLGLFALLVEALQVKGRHGEALEWLDKIARAYPQTTTDKEFTDLRKTSVKNRDKNRPTKPRYLIGDRGRDSDNPITTLIGRYTGLALLGAIALWYLGAAIWASFSQPVYLVNGLNKPYEVEFNGQTVKLAPNVPIRVTTPQGKWTARIVTPGFHAAPVDTEYRTGFFGRPFNSDIVVVNPDRAAVIMREETVYSAHPSTDSVRVTTFSVGNDRYIFHHIDYPFEEFPETVPLSNANEQVRKIGLSIPTGHSISDIASTIATNGSKTDAALYLKNHLTADPGDSDYLHYLKAYSDPKEMLEFIRSHLTDRPILVNWHRRYQELEKPIIGKKALAEEYKKLCDAEPTNCDLIYLLGRVTEPRDAATALFRRATEGEHPSAYAFNALGYDALTLADYTAAAKFLHEAVRLLPSEPYFQELEEEAFTGLSDWDALIALNHQKRKTSKQTLFLDLSEYELLLNKGDTKQAEALRTASLARADRTLSVKDATDWKNAFARTEAYSRGDIARYGKIATSDDMPFIAAVCLNDDAKATEILTQKEYDTPLNHLTVYLLSRQLGHSALAEKHFELAIQAYRNKESTNWDPIIADLLEGKNDLTSALALNRLPEEKEFILTVLGTRDPAHAAEYFREAKRYIIFHAFPEHLLLATAK